MPESSAQVDLAGWSGEGEFTQLLVDHLRGLAGIAFVRVEDAPASRSEADYNFISNEIFVSFNTVIERQRHRAFGFIPTQRAVEKKAMTIADLERALTSDAAIGPPDYSDDGMLQYLRAERIIPPYQTRGYKLVELVRVYELKATEGTEKTD
jgi:hypothetical protein